MWFFFQNQLPAIEICFSKCGLEGDVEPVLALIIVLASEYESMV